MLELSLIRFAPVLGLIFSGVCGSGCAVRVGQTEHYFGPVLFRYAQPPDAQAYVTQLLHLGLAGEAGAQWGLSLGVAERTAVAPRCACADASAQPDEMPQWRAPLSPFAPPAVGEWYLSLLYLRGDHIPKPCFLRRTLYGAAALLGSEVNAFSVGVSSRTSMNPVDNAVSLLSFDARHPLDARLIVWPAEPGRELPVDSILKEVTP